MPTYEYLCKACGHEFEREQRITDGPVKTCPACKKRRVERLISQTSFVLKGGGWYPDLYHRGKPEKDGAEKGGEEKSAPKTDAASDAGAKSDSGSKPDSGAKPDSPSKGGKPKAKGSKAAA